MPLRDKKPIDRPLNEKKFSLKNPEDKAILISLAIVISIVTVIVILIIAFGGLID